MRTGRAVARRQAQVGLSRRTRHTNSEGTVTELYGHHARSDAGDESPESDLPKLGDCLCWPAGVRIPLPCRMAGEDCRSWSAPSRRILLPAVGCLSGSASAARTAQRKPQTLLA